MKCAKCAGNMHRVQINDIEVDRCAKCEGVWFDLREHEHLKEIKGSENQVDPMASSGTAPLNEVRDINCPRCKVKLIKLAVPNQAHIMYEQCSLCGGTFFDAGEFTDFKNISLLERILQAIPGLKR